METFTTSRMSDGNKLFPSKLTLEENGLRIIMPGMFKNKETFIMYREISSVKTETPLIGYSTIQFNAQGTTITIHGFTKKEVQKIKSVLESKA